MNVGTRGRHLRADLFSELQKCLKGVERVVDGWHGWMTMNENRKRQLTKIKYKPML